MTANTDIEEHPVFIGGIPLSGTTLLCSLLDGHPELVVHPDQTGFFDTFVPAAMHMLNEERIPLAERTLLRHQYDRRDLSPQGDGGADYASVRAHFLERLLRTSLLLSDFLSAAILANAEVNGVLGEQKRLWVEGTCFNELHGERIFEWWKHARLIQIIRDPRATYAASLKCKAEHNSVSAFAHMWLRSARRARHNQSTYGSVRFLKVRYEDLVRDPRLEMERTTNFLDIQEDNVLLRPTLNSGREDWTGNSTDRQPFSGIEASSVDRWRSLLSPAQTVLLETLLGDEMLLHGYEPQSTPSSIRRLRVLPYGLMNIARGFREAGIRDSWNRPRQHQRS